MQPQSPQDELVYDLKIESQVKRVASSYVIFMFTSILCNKAVTGHNKEYSRMLSKEQEVPHQFACNEIIVRTTTIHGSRQTK